MEPTINGKGGSWETKSHWLGAVKLTLDNFKKYMGKNIILYTDSVTEHVLSHITDNVDIINVYDNVFEDHDIPLSLWNYAKLLTIRNQSEPFVHLDLDFVIKSPIPKSWYTDYDLSVQTIEDLGYMDARSYGDCYRIIYNREYNKHLYKWSEWWDKPEHNRMYAVNSSFLCMNDMNLHKNYCDLVFEFIEDNKKEINKYSGTEDEITPPFIEQQPLFWLAKERNVNMFSLAGANCDHWPAYRRYTHFMGDLMKGSDAFYAVEQRRFLLEPAIDENVCKMVDYIESL